ncbi:DUF5675 family protein [Roseococcus sp. YIM B11640]|uniref:DUF5675 family protein n=1 Tax=Roseococcus sp. YIM B11640 TaxID=3133973 RepID=UPI003C7A6D03
MELVLIRQVVVGEATIGTLQVDGKFQCHTLEDLERAEKIAGSTAIPPGSYRMTIEESPRLSARYERAGRSRKIPRLHDVKGFTGILIHIGNKPEDTDGCILVGSWKPSQGAFIANSGRAYDALHAKLSDAASLRITVRNEMAPPPAKLRQPSWMLMDSFITTIGPV